MIELYQATLARLLTQNDTTSYETVVDSSGPDGSTHIEFRTVLTITKILDRKDAFRCECMLRDAKGTTMGAKFKLAFLGSASWEIGSTGLPAIDIMGQGGSSMVPLLGLFIPANAQAARAFQFDSLALGQGLTLSGKGYVGRPVEGQQKVTWDADLGPALRAKSQVKVTSVFDIRSGKLESADGSLTAPDGTIAFKMHRITTTK